MRERSWSFFSASSSSMGNLLTTQVDLSHTIISLYFLYRPFTDDGPFVEDRHNSRNLPDKFHIVFDHDDGMFLRQ
jgi:hypothetical protein